MTDSHSHLEDFSEDIIAKAQNGLRMTNRELSERAGIDLPALKALKNGLSDEEALRKVAPQLHLSADRLVTASKKEWLQREQALPQLTTFTSQFRTMTVNAYLVTSGKRGILFDTGVDPVPILDHLEHHQVQLEAILLTHGHPDHIAVLGPLLEGCPGIPVFAHPAEAIGGTQEIQWDSPFTAGPFRLRPLSTPGHTPGGTSYWIEDQHPPITVVGDALFAGSIGGCAAAYDLALDSIRSNLLTLPDETILCPGHGPTTTVVEEKQHNPFFPN
ncbi:MAG: MBL fold metallo-hydrolase [Puniceicoccales bacterium]